MGDEVKLYGKKLSVFVFRVRIALKLKGIEYQDLEEDLSNKSANLIKYNPVHKKIPVLVHNGRPISESLLIVEYIDDVWKPVPILPLHPYEKACARFWAKFIDDKIVPSIQAIFESNGEEHSLAEACEQLQILENEFEKGNKFFGGDNINLVDIAGCLIPFWLKVVEDIVEKQFFTKDKFPKLTEWGDNFINCQAIKEILPPREELFAALKKLQLGQV